MNNSCSQTEGRKSKINTNADRAAFWPQALFICLRVSHCLFLICACSFVKNLMWPRFSLSKTNVFSIMALDCRWTLSFSVLALTSGCERTICLIAGDVRARSQLGCTQIICYAASPRPVFSLPFFNISARLSSFHSPSLHLASWWRLSFIKRPHLWGVSSLWWMTLMREC